MTVPVITGVTVKIAIIFQQQQRFIHSHLRQVTEDRHVHHIEVIVLL